MSDVSNKDKQATVVAVEETSQEPVALPADDSHLDQPLLDPNLDDWEDFKLSQKSETEASKITESQVPDASTLHPDTIKKVTEILSEWLQYNFDTESKSFLITPTAGGILLQETAGEEEHQDLNTKAYLDGYLHALADMRRELQGELADNAYFEGYEDALDDVESELAIEDSEYEFICGDELDSAYEFDSDYDSDYETEYNSDYDSEYADSEQSDTDSNASWKSLMLSEIDHELDNLREPTELDKIRIFKQLEHKYEKLIRENTNEINSIKQGIETGEILDRLSLSEVQQVSGVEALYAKLAAYVLRREQVRERQGSRLVGVRNVLNAARFEAKEQSERECYDEHTERPGRGLGFASSCEQYSHACGKGLAACEDCTAPSEGDARPYLDEFQQRSAKAGTETACTAGGPRLVY